jgi:uncharacterized membrane protein (DUF4010 family)
MDLGALAEYGSPVTGLNTTAVIHLFVSALGGAAVGVERQWSGHAEGEHARFAGVRTFTLLGTLGGMTGWMWIHGGQWLAVLSLAAGSALVVVAYAAASRRDVDGTTEVAALVVLAAGTMAGAGEIQLSSGIIALTLLLLIEKSRLHALIRLIDDAGFRAGVRFAVMALVILPLLPEGPYGPWGGVRPRQLWILVLFFSALSFAGYVARTIVGDRYGRTVTGLLGGLVSSTSVTLTFARLSRERSSEGAQLAAGVLAACSVLFVRVAVAVAVLSPSLLPDLLPLLIAPFAVGAVAAFVPLRGQTSGKAIVAAPPNPLQVTAALQMALAFQGVLFLMELARTRFGNLGLLGSAAVLGLTDVDALTVSIAGQVRLGVSPSLGAIALAVGILSNSLTKLALATAVGRGRFRTQTALGLAAMTLAGLVVVLAIGWRQQPWIQ